MAKFYAVYLFAADLQAFRSVSDEIAAIVLISARSRARMYAIFARDGAHPGRRLLAWPGGMPKGEAGGTACSLPGSARFSMMLV